MNRLKALERLQEFDQQGRFVFIKRDLAKMFFEDTPKAFEAGLLSLVKSGLLRRACQGVYVNEKARCFDSWVLDHVAIALRRNTFIYVSLESMLSEYGLISQIPLSHITLMTTGRKGIHKTPYGTIEFTHTKRSAADILKSVIQIPGRPLRVATQETALRDLKRVGRNLHLVIKESADD